jgi:coenzyme F420-reducing hydrogenase beta subunit
MTINTTDKTKCCGCGACVVVCPRSCIRLQADGEGFDYPVINLDDCIDCGKCLSVCGMQSPLDMRPVRAAYAGWHKDAATRAKGTSGSVFGALAKIVCDDGGVVAGAAFTPDFKAVHHNLATTMDQVESFHGSKYVQSATEACFSKIAEAIKNGQRIFFTGTPCQVASIRLLNKDNASNLVTCDIVCHGVPSPAVFRRYVEEMEARQKAKIVHHTFRDKSSGWNFPQIRSLFDNGKTIRSLGWADRFFHGYSKNIFLRPCCHVCPFTSPQRGGDLTIADCWRVATSHPLYDDNKGTSLVLVNSDKGETLLMQATEAGLLFLGAYDLGLAASRNTPLREPAKAPAVRQSFFDTFKRTDSFSEAAKTYMSRTFVARKRLEQIAKRLCWPILRRFQ